MKIMNSVRSEMSVSESVINILDIFGENEEKTQRNQVGKMINTGFF